MKNMLLIGGILMILLGLYFGFDGYQIKQSQTAKYEKEISNLMSYLPETNIDINKINRNGDWKLFGGIGMILIGSLTLFINLKKKNTL
jgi:hypothetical protein